MAGSNQSQGLVGDEAASARAEAEGYAPIESYGAIGNLRAVALIAIQGARAGSIDWCCLPQLDSASVFGALLDARKGGRFSVRPGLVERVEAHYLADTNVLETEFTCPEGKLFVTDFMPVEGRLEGGRASRTEPAIYRMLRAEGGPLDVDVEWGPRLDYGRAQTRIERVAQGFVAAAGADRLALAGVADDDPVEVVDGPDGPVLRARLRLEAGRRRVLVTTWGSEPRLRAVEHARERLEATLAAWRAWVYKDEATGDRSWAGPYKRAVLRSELALKLLVNADSGAIAAAATTSLPEEIGGCRNWDYRYSWIRDAALSAQALFSLGHRQEAQAFIEWAEHAASRSRGKGGLRLMYGLHGQAELDEQSMPHLEGYRRSAPVRTGNGAVDQLQLDIYGELISAAYELVRMGVPLEPDIASFIPRVADQACASWREPDYGLWEVRNGPAHFVYSKAMVWMALDRAVRLVQRGAIAGDAGRWGRQAAAIREEVLERGFDPSLGAFKQAYDRPVLDASNLLFPLMELLPFSDPRVQSTIDRTLEGLTENDLVYRYKADDGLPGREGAFGLCTFWLVDALAMSDRMDEAQRVYEGLLARANPVGLYAEQIDPRSGAFLGNFPQAFSHLGVINSALYLAYKEGRPSPVPAPIGSDEHRRDG
jgi:GH15 family glucan-1,4-alpha-glucosidase